jgi:hypothetical protein
MLEIDTSKAHPARVCDCLLGGKDNYADPGGGRGNAQGPAGIARKP